MTLQRLEHAVFNHRCCNVRNTVSDRKITNSALILNLVYTDSCVCFQKFLFAISLVWIRDYNDLDDKLTRYMKLVLILGMMFLYEFLRVFFFFIFMFMGIPCFYRTMEVLEVIYEKNKKKKPHKYEFEGQG
ncbi:transmembrane protein, putative [Medicago truncatula]|uniref:Transmembrane protein, putative n=1 Tax=Medicago truncatula TaxID=3880 RepID=G7KU44_MEDTR|nr:transmembrane protein, putative [Medicago truncatula]